MKTWSVTQATVTLSSGDAEYCADVKGGIILLGFRSLLQDLGVVNVKCHLHTDSSAAVGIANRVGIGKIRHLAVHLLWLQEKIRSGDICIHKVDGSSNVADVMTKHLAHDSLGRHLPNLRLEFMDGRAMVAPRALI